MNNRKGIIFTAAGLAAILIFSCIYGLRREADLTDDISYGFESSTGEYQVSSAVTTEITVISSVAKTTAAVTEYASAASETTVSTVPEPLYIDINSASQQELMKLDGIGEVLAARIIDYRQQYGDFRNIEELLLVEGIGQEKLDSISSFVYVENPVYTQPAEEDYPEEQTPEDTPEEPADEETTEPEISLAEAAPININTAGTEELMLLPHVTEEIAGKIIDLRTRIGGFSHPYELLYVEELQQNEVAEIVEFVTVGE